jgi:uncharacterized protein
VWLPSATAYRRGLARDPDAPLTPVVIPLRGNDGRQRTAPTDPDQRIHSLDLLRGFALLGMFIVHFHVRTSETDGLDEAIRTLIWRLVEGKSHGTFALLFGAGFAIQLRRAGERKGFTTLYLRRLSVLALFGFVAHAFFGYNVLLGYAVWGVPLLFIGAWSTRALLVTAALCAVSLALYHLAASVMPGPDGVAASTQALRAEAVAVNGALHAAEAQPSYAVLLAARLRHMAWFYSQPFFFVPGATMTLFLAGLLMVRHRVFENVRAHGRLMLAMLAFGLISWLAANWLVPFLGVLRDQWLTFSYVAGALLLLARRPTLASRLRHVANAGRMALTNYLLQIATLDLLFSGYAVGLGTVSPRIGFAAALACFAAEAAFSTVWLRHFRFGPAEWLWRSITYGCPQPMRGAALPASPESASV